MIVVAWIFIILVSVSCAMSVLFFVARAIQFDRFRNRIKNGKCIICGEPAAIMKHYVCIACHPFTEPVPMCEKHISESGGELYCEEHFLHHEEKDWTFNIGPDSQSR